MERTLATGQSCRSIGSALGDATSINVLMRVLGQALLSAGLVDAPLPDIWEKSSLVVGRMPDALYSQCGLL